MTTLPWGRALTRADLATMPDDGHRYELLDGVLLVSPAPGRRHQRALTRLWLLLSEAAPPHLEVLAAPFDVVLDDLTVLLPDLVVALRDERDAIAAPHGPAVVVEVLSPSTRRFDLVLKRVRYEASGIPLYVVVDPVEPSVTVLQLQDGVYVETARAAGSERTTLPGPCPASFAPADLVD